MKNAIWSSPLDARGALGRLGLPIEPLERAVRAGYVARISTTISDAPTAPGFYQWNETLKMLRQSLVVEGWQPSEKSGISTIVDPGGAFAICVSSGNENTGVASLTPSTKNPKGPRTEAAVETNLQTAFDFLSENAPVPSLDGMRPTWTLLFFTDIHETRSELSLPILIAGGQINDWKERIILPVIPHDGDWDKGARTPDFGPEVDVDIRRLA